MHARLYELAPIHAFGPGAEQAGFGLIPGFPYSAPVEEVSLKKP